MKFIKLEFVEAALWERTLRGGCVIYKNAGSLPAKAHVTRMDNIVLELDIPASKEVLACGDVALINT